MLLGVKAPVPRDAEKNLLGLGLRSLQNGT